jgi:hypothetical protein
MVRPPLDFKKYLFCLKTVELCNDKQIFIKPTHMLIFHSSRSFILHLLDKDKIISFHKSYKNKSESFLSLVLSAIYT